MIFPQHPVAVVWLLESLIGEGGCGYDLVTLSNVVAGIALESGH